MTRPDGAPATPSGQGDWGGLGRRKGPLLVLLLLLGVIGAVTESGSGTRVDVGGLFFPLGAVLVLLISAPTLRVVERFRRPATAAAGVLIALLAVLGLSVDPGPVRLVGAVLFLLVGLFFVLGAAVPAVGARFPGFFPVTRG